MAQWNLCITIGVICLALATGQITKPLRQVAEWMEMEYAFPSPEERESAIATGKYVSGNSLPIDMDVFYTDQGPSKVFVTIPRFLTGIPVTLGTLSANRGRGGPLIEPYPDYSWHSAHGENCNGLISVFRVAIDKCNRLWVLDAGRIGRTQYCPPQLVVFNLDNDQMIYRYTFPEGQYRPGTSLFITPIVDVRDPPPGQCSNTMVYIGDANGFLLIVYDHSRQTSWRIENKLIFPHPSYGTFTIAGESFDIMGGIMGMSLSAASTAGQQNYVGFFGNNYLGGNSAPVTKTERLLYFHALSSVTENSIPLRLLDNQTMWQNNANAEPRSFIEIGSRGIQSSAQAMDRNGNLFFGLMSPISIACWDSSLPYNQNNMRIVAQDDERLQFASGVKIVTNRQGQEEVWVLTCRFQKYSARTLNVNEPNFRIQALPVDDLLGGTRCFKGVPASSIITFPNYNIF